MLFSLFVSATFPQTNANPAATNTKSNPGDKSSTPPVPSVTTQTMIVTDRKGVPTKCEFKVLKTEPSVPKTGSSSTSKQPTIPPSSFSHGDFLKDITKKGDWIWQVDGMNLLQKFVPTKNPKTGETLYKSSFTYDGLNAMNAVKFQKISTTIINKIKNETYVRVNEDLNPLEVNVKSEPVDPELDNQENVVSSSEPVESVKPPADETNPNIREASDTSQPSNKQQPSDIRMPVIPVSKANPALAMVHHVEAPGIANYKNTFKDDFSVFLQALISQCLDSSFLRACYNDKDEYFPEKIKTIDDVLEAKKFSLMSLPSFPNNERILYAIHMYPIIEEQQLPAIKMENLNCVVCVEQGADKLPACSSLCLKLTGEPYERNTLLNVKLLVDIDDDLKVLRVCSTCSKILKLYSKMCHSKYLIYKQCEKVVAKIMEKQKEKMEASEVIISLLSNEPWCETKLLQIIKDWISVDDLKKET